MNGQLGPARRMPLAIGACVAALGALLCATVSPVVGLICAVTIPLTILGAPRWPGPVASGVGIAHLALVVDLTRSFDGHDARYALVVALLALAGLHASRLETARDRDVAVGIQLAVVACGLSQLGSSGSDRFHALVWVAAWAFATAPSLRPVSAADVVRVAPAGGRRPGGSMAVLAGVVAAAALLWAVIPLPSARTPRDLLGAGGSPNPTASAGRSSDAPGTGRVGLGSKMDLDARGTGSQRPVLDIAGSPALWRAQVFDAYDGRSFTTTPSPFLHPEPRGESVAVPLPRSAGDVSSHAIITVSQLVDQAGPLSVGQPLAVTAQASLDVDQLGNVFSQGLPAGSVYTTVGGSPGATPHAGAQPADAASWLQLPAELPQRIRQLAAGWTHGTIGPDAAVAAIQAHLRAGFAYDLNSPVASPGADAVDDMLFRSHRGFCEQFASSTTVLLRSLGIPSRVVGGYAYGIPEDDGSQLVRDADAHAWIEFWRPGVGWITADPTAGIPLAAPQPSLTHRLWHDLAGLPGYVWLLLALGAALGITLVVVLRRLRRRSPATAAAGAVAPQLTPVADAFEDLLRALSDTGAPRQPVETPGDVLLRVPGGWAVRELILPALERELWGPAPPTARAADLARDALGALTRGVLTSIPV